MLGIWEPELGPRRRGAATVSPVDPCGGAGVEPAALSTSRPSSQITRFRCFPAQDFMGVGGKRPGLIVLSSVDVPFTADRLKCYKIKRVL